MEKVFSTDQEIDISFAVGLLENEGITTFVMARGAGDYFDKMGIKQGVVKDIYVRNTDYDKAKKLLSNNRVINKQEHSIQNRIVAIVIVIIFILIILFSMFETINH